MEKGGKTYHINIGMSVQKAAQAFQRMRPGLRLPDIKGNLRFYIFPVIYYCIVHMNRVPHDISQKTYGIFMEQFCRLDYYIPVFFLIGPFGGGDYFSCSSVYYFPPSCNIIMGIYFQHIRIQMIHQMNFQFV